MKASFLCGNYLVIGRLIPTNLIYGDRDQPLTVTEGRPTGTQMKV